MSFRTVAVQRVPEARLEHTNLRVEQQSDPDTYIIYVPHRGKDFVLSVPFKAVYYCIFRHQRKTFEVVGHKAIFSGFPNENGVVERFNITLQSDITDPAKRRLAEKQHPIIWCDVYECIRPRVYVKGGGEEDEEIQSDCIDGPKPVCYTDHRKSKVDYGTTEATKGTRLRVIKFILKLEDVMDIYYIVKNDLSETRYIR